MTRARALMSGAVAAALLLSTGCGNEEDGNDVTASRALGMLGMIASPETECAPSLMTSRQGQRTTSYAQGRGSTSSTSHATELALRRAVQALRRVP